MPTDRIWYPERLRLLQTDIVQLSDCTPAYNYEDLDESSPGLPGPGFVGVTQAKPSITFRTRQVKDIWDEMVYEDLCAPLHEDAVPNPYTVRFYFRAGEPFGVRQADAGADHKAIDLVNSAFLSWESFSADQGQPAEVDARLDVAVQDLAGEGDPFLWYGTTTLPSPTAPAHVYTLGPVYINGVQVKGTESVRWENRIQREERLSDGDPFPTYQAIRSLMPNVRITTTDVGGFLSNMTGASKRAFDLTSNGLQVYLRKLDENEIHVADATAEHILIQMARGLVQPRQVSNNPSQVEVSVRGLRVDAATPFFTINTATAIP